MENNESNAIDIKYSKQEHIEVSKKPNFTHLILGGGGFMGAVYTGAFSYLYQQKELTKNIKTVIGTSVGSVFATAFVLDIPMKEIEKYWKYIFNENTKLYDIDVINFLTIFDTLGIDDGMRSIQIFADYLKQMTFLDISKKTGKDLIICATNAHNMKATYFSVNTTPNVLVIDAVNASCAIPILVKPVRIGDTYYIDGGITDDLAINAIPDHISSDNILIMSLSGCGITETKELSFPLLISNILTTFITNPGRTDIFKKKYKYYIPFTNIPIESVQYKIIDDKIYIHTICDKLDKCFEIGYETMYLKIKEWSE